MRAISQAGLGDFEPVKQIQNEAERRVIEGQPGPEPLDARHHRHLPRREAQAAAGVPLGVEQPEGDQPGDQFRVGAGSLRERFQIEPCRAYQREGRWPVPAGPVGARWGVHGHRPFRGSKSETAASCSNSSRSVPDSLGGTITWTSAVIGTPGGEAKVKVPAGTSTGRRLRLRGRGLPSPRGKDGDLLAEVQVMVPPKLSGTERELFEQLAAVSDFDPRKGR